MGKMEDVGIMKVPSELLFWSVVEAQERERRGRIEMERGGAFFLCL